MITKIRVPSIINNNQGFNKKAGTSPVNLKINEFGFDSFSRSEKLSFKGKPVCLEQSENPNIDDVLELYDELRDGSYLDIHDDPYNPQYKQIRKQNLRFLDSLKTDSQKRKFVDYFMNLTDFPDFKRVSQKIESHFVSTIKMLENDPDLNAKIPRQYCKCIAAGYDGTCSVGKGYAFPGSDLDKSYIVIRGSMSDDKINEELVKYYKDNLWKRTDQRILSFNHDTSFPTIMTLKQIKDTIQEIDEKTQGVVLDKNRLTSILLAEYKRPDYAGTYNIQISDYFPAGNKFLNKGQLNKEDVKNFAFFIESVREGITLIGTEEFNEFAEQIEDYDFYKYTNAAQMKAIKMAVCMGEEKKNKILKRINLENSFKDLPVEIQFDFIKSVIRYSCEDEEEYFEYFKNDRDMKLTFKNFLGSLTKRKGEYYIPEFTPIKDGVEMKYGEGKSVKLYNSMNTESLWIDSNKEADIARIMEDIDKIKLIERFKNVETIRFPKSEKEIVGAEEVKDRTSDEKTIYEVKLP